MLVDTGGIRFVVAPGRFPPRLPFVLVRDDGLIPETLSLLRAFAPQAPFGGHVTPDARPDEVGPGTAAVVSSAAWPAVVARLRRHLPPDRIVVLLNPGDYPWGYLEVARAAPDHVGELADPRVPIGLKVGWLRDYLARYAYTAFEGGRPVWFPECYLTSFRDQLRQNAGAIQDVTAGLADQASRDAYNLVLFGSPEELLTRYLARVFHEQQYVELAQLRPGDTVVNAGVADGWDIPYLLADTRAAGRHLLVDPVESVPGTPAATLREAFGLEFAARGLWDVDEVLEFPVDAAGMVVGTRPGESCSGQTSLGVRCVPLDDLVREGGFDRVDFIKMDVEGAEPRALRGMRETLRRFRPQLAVCIYHQPDHMWTIPTELMAALPDYSFFVRHYSPVRFECVFYAIPSERLAATSGSGDPLLDETGIDGRLLRRVWAAAGAGLSFDDELTRHTAGTAEPVQLEAAARAIDAELGRRFAATPAGDRVVEAQVSTSDDRFLGTGWGPAGWNRRYSWRWFGPDGGGSVFLPLDRTAAYACRLYLFQADGQDAYETSALEVNGDPAVDRQFGRDGDYHFIQWRIQAGPDDPTRGLSRLRFRTVSGPKRVSVSKVSCRRIG